MLIGEDAGREVLSCDAANLPRIKEVAAKYGVSLDQIGETIPEKLGITVDGHEVVSASVSELRDLYEGALETALRTEPEVVAAD